MTNKDNNDFDDEVNNIIKLKKLTKTEKSIKDLKTSKKTKKNKTGYKFKSKKDLNLENIFLNKSNKTIFKSKNIKNENKIRTDSTKIKESNSITKSKKHNMENKTKHCTIKDKKTNKENYLQFNEYYSSTKYSKVKNKAKKINNLKNIPSSKIKKMKILLSKVEKPTTNSLSKKENKKSVLDNLFKIKSKNKNTYSKMTSLNDNLSSQDISFRQKSNVHIVDYSTSRNKSKIAIDVKNVTMLFKLNAEKVDNLKEYFIKTVKGEIKTNELLALDDVSFTIKKGERWGIIGLNGAGKSTLLKIIAGVMKPTEGDVKVFGKVAPLLELGAGFDHNYTGRENIYLNGAILGYSKEFIEEKYHDIVEFSGLEKFIDVPIKNYSSGMKSKLGFSIATLVEPDVLILDEVLAVGDAKFKKKSGDKIKSMFDSGITVILVSHSIGQIKDLCDKALWLENGKIVMIGEVNEVCQAYEESTK